MSGSCIWKIQHIGRAWVANYGMPKTGTTNPCVLGNFAVYESARHDTKTKAIKYASRGGFTGRNKANILLEEAAE